METTQHVSLVRYWNYIVSPLLVTIALFGTYIVATLKPIQTMNARQVADGIGQFKRKGSSI